MPLQMQMLIVSCRVALHVLKGLEVVTSGRLLGRAYVNRDLKRTSVHAATATGHSIL
jgi:hypothetical protein